MSAAGTGTKPSHGARGEEGMKQLVVRTDWFVGSLSTQVLVIFIIRTAYLLRDPPHPALVTSTLLTFAVAMALRLCPANKPQTRR